MVDPILNLWLKFLCVCKSHYVDCLIKELCIENSLGNPTYTPTTLTTEEILDNHSYVPLEFQPEIKNWIYHNSTGFLNYTSVERDLDCMYSNRSLDFFRIHI
jgi:hypothetical protein